MNDLAPIILFVYNRPTHALRTINALKKNTLASSSDLYIISDAHKTRSDDKAVKEVRATIRDQKGFKSITIIERSENFGLAKNITLGVSEIINKYGKVIVLEDDIVSSPYFLQYMNDALNFYENKEKIYHISGWNYPIKTDDLNDVFAWRVMNCWGWATWANRWKYYEKDPEKLIKTFNRRMVKQFNVDRCNDFWRQVKKNKSGEKNTWAIFWYATIFLRGGLCINPSHSFVENIGDDGSGTNHSSTNTLKKIELNKKSKIKFISQATEDSLAVGRIKEYYKQRKISLLKKARIKLLNIKG